MRPLHGPRVRASSLLPLVANLVRDRAGVRVTGLRSTKCFVFPTDPRAQQLVSRYGS